MIKNLSRKPDSTSLDFGFQFFCFNNDERAIALKINEEYSRNPAIKSIIDYNRFVNFSQLVTYMFSSDELFNEIVEQLARVAGVLINDFDDIASWHNESMPNIGKDISFLRSKMVNPMNFF